MMPTPRHQFYVTAIDGSPLQGRVYFLAGPYPTREDAERAVQPVRDIARDETRNASAGRAMQAPVAHGLWHTVSVGGAGRSV